MEGLRIAPAGCQRGVTRSLAVHQTGRSTAPVPNRYGDTATPSAEVDLERRPIPRQERDQLSVDREQRIDSIGHHREVAHDGLGRDVDLQPAGTDGFDTLDAEGCWGIAQLTIRGEPPPSRRTARDRSQHLAGAVAWSGDTFGHRPHDDRPRRHDKRGLRFGDRDAIKGPAGHCPVDRPLPRRVVDGVHHEPIAAGCTVSSRGGRRRGARTTPASDGRCCRSTPSSRPASSR